MVNDAPLRRYYTESELSIVQNKKIPLYGYQNEGRNFFELHTTGNSQSPVDIQYHANRGMIEVIPEVSEINDLERTDTVIIDLDPKDPKLFGMDHLKWSTAAVYTTVTVKNGPLDGNFKILATKFRFSGNRSFHIYIRLQKKYQFEDIRKTLKTCLEPLTKLYPVLRYQNMRTTNVGPPRTDFILIDVGAMSRHRCVRALWSLHNKTNLVCVPVTDINSFDISQSEVANVLRNGSVHESF